ncbi:hypothetical protein [Streptomyces brasiliensis]|uniref:Uncharacterized protein n=1 Tax=Streptomyces brasiliensis TaxID=1954 RepID=A0A917PCY9_9ACTN|nr:hypothetical protein [Streptomyces brasiliensis]GGJ71450.1 hypothetical protein GCM10010121_097600 [Streptomyces brasiliensis]
MDDLESEVIESPVVSRDRDETVAEIYVVELECADVAGTSCVDGGQDERQSVFGCRSSGDDLLVVGLGQGQDRRKADGARCDARVGFLKISR